MLVALQIVQETLNFADVRVWLTDYATMIPQMYLVRRLSGDLPKWYLCRPSSQSQFTDMSIDITENSDELSFDDAITAVDSAGGGLVMIKVNAVDNLKVFTITGSFDDGLPSHRASGFTLPTATERAVLTGNAFEDRGGSLSGSQITITAPIP